GPGVDGEHLLAADRGAVRADPDRGAERLGRAADTGGRDGMTFAERKHELRERSELYLRLAAMEDIRRRYPDAGTRPAAYPPAPAFWRTVFVPLYRRLPWHVKQRAMRTLRMTSEGWPEGARQFGTPWRPPPGGARHDSGMAEERVSGTPAAAVTPLRGGCDRLDQDA